MEHEHEKEERSFIREHIVPRKNAKKVILTILATVGLALLFGAIAGVSFYVSQNVMKANTKDPLATEAAPSIVPIGRDDEPTVAPTEPETELQESSAEETESSGATETVTETVPETEPPTTLKTIYQDTKNGFLSLVISDESGENLFGRPVVTKRNSFAAIVAETEGSVFCIFDGTYLTENSVVTAKLQNTEIPCERMGVDRMTGLSVLRVPKSGLTRDYTVISLGSSLFVNASDRVFLVGAQQGEFPCLDEGIITHVTPYEDVTDGYRKRFFTNMHRENGTSAVALNENGEIIGWVTDCTGAESGPASALGISSLKYLIEDLSSEMKTAYLGIVGQTVSGEEAADMGLAKGYYVREIEENSPAALCGMKAGDRLVSVGGATVSTSRELQNVVDTLIIDQEISVFVARRMGDKEETVELVLRVGERP